ncbi:hypothetical protein KFU94_68960, partial [Chloroflexi bacterium TSY]|nr:hypothetical protein [Chloroflexi bacterium TSY]
GAQVEEFKSLYKRYWEWKQEEKRKNDNVAQELKVIDSEREQEQSLKTILFDEDESTIYVPWSLPDRIPYFKFRSEVNTNSEVQQLQKLLATDSVVTLYGPGGVGKTALAIEIAWSVLSEEIVRDIYPDCIL